MTVRRMKSYTGQTGYVYQYYFVGQRPAIDEPATEYIFDVTSDRKTTYSVSILLQHAAVERWQQSHGRQLVEAEHYASAKMRLFRAFDEIESMFEQGRRLVIMSEELDELLQVLGVD